MNVNFSFNREQLKLAGIIADRYRTLQERIGFPPRDRQDIVMDLDATHSNGCPLDLEKLAAADDFNLGHDVGGIAAHLNRDTGKLERCFLPRCHA